MSQPKDPANRELRVFVSSTFRDFQRERELLINQVVPEVRALARERGVELTVVDLRWGLTDEQAELGGAVLTCLREVAECHPHFIGMLGERYGWVPESTDWGADPSAPELSARIAGWIRAKESVTAMEIRHGVLDQPQEQRHAYFYRREAALTERLKAEDPDNADAYSESDPQARDRQEKLRRQIAEGAGAGGWHSRDYHSLDAFVAKVREDLLSDLDRCFPADEQPTELERQRAAHHAYARDRLALYVEPTRFLNEAFEAFESPEGNHRLLFTGPSGIGKSSAVAALVQGFQQSHPHALIVEHYPGAAPGGRPAEILRRALEAMRARLEEPEELPADEKSVIEAFPAWLARMSHAGIDTLIAVDALNQVEPAAQGGAPMGWLPDPSLAHVYLLVAAQPGEDALALAERGWTERAIPALDAAQRDQIIQGFLERRRKHLTAAQIERLVRAEATHTPLYLRVLLDELGAFGGLKHADVNQNAFMDQVLDRYLSRPDAAALYQEMIERLEEAFGAPQCRRFFGLLAASRAGLTENELMRIGDLHPLLLARLRYALDFHLSNRDGLLGFAHQALEQAATERCGVGPAKHRKIAEFFAAQPLNVRQAFELPWQWVQAQAWEPLKAYLSQPAVFDYFTADETHPRYYEYMGYWRASGADGKEIGERLLREIEEFGGGQANVATGLDHAGEYLRRSGLHEEAESLYREALAIEERVLGLEHLETVTTCNNLALVLQAQDKLDEAEPLFRKALDIFKKELGPKHPKTATGYNNLALLLNDQYKPEEAEPLFREALAIRKQVLGLENPETATNYNNLALVLQAQDKLDEAEPLYRKALDIWKRELGPKHPETATGYNNLAGLLQDQRKLGEADLLYREALAICEELLGPEHPDTAQSYNNLAMLLKAQSKLREAESLCRKALAIEEKVLGPEHRHTATSYDNLAGVLKSQNKPNEAELLYREALVMREMALGHKHADTATSYHNLAVFLQERNRPGEAEPLYREALTIRKNVFGLEHRHTATSYNSLAGLLQNQLRLDEAEPLSREALNIRKNKLGPDHLDTAQSYNNLAVLLLNQYRLEEAKPLCLEALTIREKKLGPEHPDTATSYHNLAVLLREQGRLDEAEPLFQEALTIRKRVLRPDHPDMATSYHDLALLLAEGDRLKEAAPLFDESLNIRERVLGPEHPDTAKSRHTLMSINYLRLAERFQREGKPDEAEAFSLRAMESAARARSPG